jgi:para-nitrobenzyl esterase
MFRVVGSEKDCLSINIYSPKVKANGTLPVIAFIHGGSFAFGSGAEFGPSYLLEKNVVLVSMNYRLGVLGKKKIKIS